MAKISGTLTDGAGQIINDCSIELYAKKTTNNVLIQTQAFTVANNGRYSINAQPCEYEVSLIINGFPKKRLGTINVYTDSVDGSLNDYLINPSENDLTPEFLKQVFDVRSEAKNSAIASSLSATNSANSAAAAKTSEINAQSSANISKTCATNASESATTATKAAVTANTAATNSKTSADHASESATAANQSVKQALDSAKAAKISETNANNAAKNAQSSADSAKTSADNAKDWASTFDTSNFVEKTGLDSQSICGELKIGSLSVNEKINASEILENGNRVYSPNNKPDADIIGALPATRIVDNEISTYSVDDNVDFKKIPTVGGKSVLGTGDYGVGSYTGVPLNNPDETLPGGCYATRTTSFPELQTNRNDSASLIVYPAWTKNWYVEKLAVVQSKTPRIYYRCAAPEGKQSWYEAITTANINDYLPRPPQPQVWHNEISQRAANVVYTNTTGQTIFVMISFQHGWSGTAIEMRLFINDMEFYATAGGAGSGSTKNVAMYMPIPAGCTYKVTGGGNLTAWYELR